MIEDPRRMRPGQSHLYLLCYAWQRYRQLSDNFVEAFEHHLRKMQQETKEASEAAFVQAQAKRQQEAPRVGRVLLLYVDEAVEDVTPFGTVRSQAFAILPREALLTAGKRLCEKPVGQLELRWQAIDRVAARFKQNLRPLAMALERLGSSLPLPAGSQVAAPHPVARGPGVCRDPPDVRPWA